MQLTEQARHPLHTRSMHRSRRLALVVSAAVLLAACGGSDDAASDTTAATAAAATADVTTTADTADPDSASVQQPERFQVPAPPADGRYEVGDTYYDEYLSATHLGLVEIPVGPDVFTGGSCYAILLEVSWYDSANDPGFGDEFRASTTGILASGAEAVSDNTGVGCVIKDLPALGYERSIETQVAVGETKQVHLGAIHVPDGETLDSIQLYDSDRTVFAATVVLDATS